MNAKKLALIGAVALVVLGCVIAAGCTSTQSTTNDQSVDSIVGVWHSAYTGSDGKTVKQTDIIQKDGSVYFLLNYDDGTVKYGTYPVKKMADGTYVAHLSDQDYTWTLNAAKDTITSTSGRSKKLMNNAQASSIIGVWANDEQNYLTVFNADGAGITYKGKGNGMNTFTWTCTEPGKINIHYMSGTDKASGSSIAGADVTWTFDTEKNTLTSSQGTTYSRPTGDRDGFTRLDVSTPTTSTEKIVGAWIAPFDNGKGLVGKTVEVFNADGTGYYTLYEDLGFTHLLDNGQFTWKKNADGTYERIFKSSVQTVTYHAEKDTYTDSKYPSAVKTRMDKITGIWAGTGKDSNGNPCTITHVLLNDGTGYHFKTLENGTVTGGKLIWTGNSDGTYVLKFSGFSDQSTWKLNAAGNEITSSSGRLFKKYFADSYYYLSYLGKWVGKDSNSTVVLCGDGTGLRVNGTSGDLATFSWSIPEFGKLTCHFLSGNSSLTGKPLAGTDTAYTYDRANDIFVNDVTGYRYGHDLIWNKA